MYSQAWEAILWLLQSGVVYKAYTFWPIRQELFIWPSEAEIRSRSFVRHFKYRWKGKLRCRSLRQELLNCVEWSPDSLRWKEALHVWLKTFWKGSCNGAWFIHCGSAISWRSPFSLHVCSLSYASVFTLRRFNAKNSEDQAGSEWFAGAHYGSFVNLVHRSS